MMIRINNIFRFLAVVCSVTTTLAVVDQIQISSAKATVLVFDDIIDELELGNNEYVTKIKGKFLLIRAKSLNSKPTFLFVRYSNGSKFYNLEISPSNQAPLEYVIRDKNKSESSSANSNTGAANILDKALDKTKVVKYFFSKKQRYYTYSKKQYGIRVSLIDIIHCAGSTYFKLNIKNSSSIDMCIDYVLFNYYDKSSFIPLISSKINIKNVDPTFLPDSLVVSSFSSNDYVFGIPTISVNGGLDIRFGETDEGRTIDMSIPSKVLLNAINIK
jgi:hypothetical protein